MPALIEYDDLQSNIDLCRSTGLSFIELNMNLPYSFPERIDPLVLRRTKDEEGIGFSIHLHDETDLGSLHRQVREGHLDRAVQTLEWAGSAEVFLINLHLNPGVFFTLPDRKVWVYDRYADEYVANLQESFTTMSELAEEFGIMICIENTGHFRLPFMRRAAEALLSLPNIFLTWDIGHDAVHAWAESPFMRRNAGRLRHMHFHDCIGNHDHLIPFTGGTDCDNYLRLAKERDLTVVVEIKTSAALDESVNILRSRHYL